MRCLNQMSDIEKNKCDILPNNLEEQKISSNIKSKCGNVSQKNNDWLQIGVVYRE